MKISSLFGSSLNLSHSFLILLLFCSNNACFINSHIDEGTESLEPSSDSPIVQFQTSSQFAAESVGTATITVIQNTTSSNATVAPLSFGGTANGGGVDYTLASTTVTIPAGQVFTTLTVSIVSDAVLESDESLIVTLGTPTNATLGTRKVHTLNITTACDPTITTNYGGGLGTPASPYTICSLDQWDYFATDSGNWDKRFRLESDLDFNGVNFTNFKMIGDSTTAFTGQLDGNSRTIKNISLNATSDVGLFLKTDGTVQISDLTLQDITISSTGKVGSLVVEHGSAGSLTLTSVNATNISIPSAANNSGGLVAISGSAFVADQVTLSAVTFAGTGENAGGLIGRCSSTCTISNLTGSNIARVTTSDGEYSSGIVAISLGDLTITDVHLTGLNMRNLYAAGVCSYFTGNVSLTRVNAQGAVVSNLTAGGLIRATAGFASVSLSIVDSSFDGTVYGGGGVGGLVYSFEGDISISKSFVKGNVFTAGNTAGGLADFAGNAAGKTVSILDSYVTASVQGGSAPAYLSGLIHGAGGASVSISRSYFSGSLGATGNRSCIMADTASATSLAMNDIYYNSTLCPDAQSSLTGSIAGVTGLATGSFQIATPFSNWLSSVWTFSSGSNPKLAREP